MKNARSAPNTVTLTRGGSPRSSTTRNRLQLTACISLALLCAGCAKLTPVSVGQTGAWANADSRDIDVSPDGRYVAFSSSAGNLVSNCNPFLGDVIYFRDTYENTLRSFTSTATDGCGTAHSPSIAFGPPFGPGPDPLLYGDAAVAFVSKIFSMGYPSSYDSGHDRVFVFRFDPDGSMYPHFTEHCVPNSNGPGLLPRVVANGPCTEPDLSAAGYNLVYSSTASNLLMSGGNSNSDVYIVRGDTDPNYADGRPAVDLVSRSASGGASNGDSHSPSISGSGRYVAFASTATDLIFNDANGVQDIFVRDVVSQVVWRVSRGYGFQQSNGDSFDPVISADGRYVAFTSRANNMRPEDPYGEPDVYVYDRFLETTKLVSIDLPGPVRLHQAGDASISGDGRFISFHSYGPLAVSDTNSLQDVYTRDMEKGITKRVSEGTFAAQGSARSFGGAMSDDGRYVAFLTDAEDLYSGDTNGFTDVYMKSAIEPTVDSITPYFLPAGATTSVTITGSYFMTGATPDIPNAGISNIVIVDENTITADVTVAFDATFDYYDLHVYLYATGPANIRGSSAAVCADCVLLF